MLDKDPEYVETKLKADDVDERVLEHSSSLAIPPATRISLIAECPGVVHGAALHRTLPLTACLQRRPFAACTLIGPTNWQKVTLRN